MPVQFELLIVAILIPLVIAALALAGASRLRKKLAAGAKPTWSTYTNELGGYLIVGLVFLLCGMALLIEACFHSPGSNISVPLRLAEKTYGIPLEGA